MRTQTLQYLPGTVYAIPSYFRDLDGIGNAWLCRTVTRRYVELSENCDTIRLVATKAKPDNDEWWEITSAGKLEGLRAELTMTFIRWLQLNYFDGYRYFYIDYEVTP